MYNRDIELAEAAAKAGSCALAVNIIAKRIRQLHRGAKPLIEKTAGHTALDIALREYAESKIDFRRRTEK